MLCFTSLSSIFKNPATLLPAFFIAGFVITPVCARVTKIEILTVESPAFQGYEFGPVGRYEKIIGRVHGEVVA